MGFTPAWQGLWRSEASGAQDWSATEKTEIRDWRESWLAANQAINYNCTDAFLKAPECYSAIKHEL